MAVARAKNRYTKPGSLIFDFAAIRLLRSRRHISPAHVEPTYFRPFGLSSLNPHQNERWKPREQKTEIGARELPGKPTQALKGEDTSDFAADVQVMPKSTVQSDPTSHDKRQRPPSSTRRGPKTSKPRVSWEYAAHATPPTNLIALDGLIEHARLDPVNGGEVGIQILSSVMSLPTTPLFSFTGTAPDKNGLQRSPGSWSRNGCCRHQCWSQAAASLPD